MRPLPPLICPDQLTGDYNGGVLQFHVYLPFDGDLIFDATDSDFNIINLQGFQDNAGNLGTELGTDGGIEEGDFDGNDDILRLNELETGNYIFIIQGNPGTIGIFDISINCHSNSPTSNPTLSPSNNPTPRPTNPRQLTCPDELTGDYNGGVLQFHVYLPFDGDLIFDVTASNFNIINLQGFENNAGNIGKELATDGGVEDGDSDTNDDILRINNIPSNDYILIIEGNPGTIGIFDISIKCHSNSPTLNPTINPSINPSPSPTNPPLLICPAQLTGDYNGGVLQFPIELPMDGDIIFDASNSDFDIINLQGFTNDAGDLGIELGTDGGVEDSDGNRKDDILRLNNLSSGLYIFIIEGRPGTIGIFEVIISCTTNIPTNSPITTNPTSSPSIPPSISPTTTNPTTSFPTRNPTNVPTIDPTTAPTSDPSIDPTIDPSLAPSISPITLNPTTNGPTTANPTTSEPTMSPTENPLMLTTISPTSFPSVSPTNNPTEFPSVSPITSTSTPLITTEALTTTEPTGIPSDNPSNNPTNNPTTAQPGPLPTDPYELQCGDQISDAYNGGILSFGVQLLYTGDITFDASNSDFDIINLKAFEKRLIGNTWRHIQLGTDGGFGDADIQDHVLKLNHLSIGNYVFTIEATNGTIGIFEVIISCETNIPTNSPITTNPTPAPSIPPSISPSTTNPTIDPITEPTTAPTSSPTQSRTNNPTPRPTKNVPDCLLQSKCLEVEIIEQDINIYTICIYWQRNDDCNRRKGKIANICSNDEIICKWQRGENHKICERDIACGHDAKFHIHDAKGCKYSDDWYGDISNNCPAICMYTGYKCSNRAACTWIFFTPQCQGSSLHFSDHTEHTEHREHTKSKERKKSIHRYRRWK